MNDLKKKLPLFYSLQIILALFTALFCFLSMKIIELNIVFDFLLTLSFILISISLKKEKKSKVKYIYYLATVFCFARFLIDWKLYG